MKVHELLKYYIIRHKEQIDVLAALNESKVADKDIRAIVFDMFSRRKKFVYDLSKRIILYLGYLGYMLRFCRCKRFDADSIIYQKKTYQRAVELIEKDCDIKNIMDVTRRYSNFENNFLTNKQKLLLFERTKLT